MGLSKGMLEVERSTGSIFGTQNPMILILYTVVSLRQALIVLIMCFFVPVEEA